MKVTDHNKYRLFEYQNHMSNPNFQLGQVLTKIDRTGKPLEEEYGNPIGVVIQLHEDGDCRTDMYGNVCPEEVRLATHEEILHYRPELCDDLK